MSSVTENTLSSQVKRGSSQVSILDESLFAGLSKGYKILCSAGRSFLSISAVDVAETKFAGFEAFHFPKQLNDEQLADKISSLPERSEILKKVNFRSASVQLCNQQFTFIPQALFKPEDAANYFQFNHPANQGNYHIHHEAIRGFDAVNIFSVSETLHTGMKKIFEEFTLHHQVTSLLESVRVQFRKQDEKILFLHIHSENVDIIVSEGRKLILCNSFPFSSIEDACYYVLFVCEQLSLNPDQIKTVLSGEVDRESALSKFLQKYIRHISFGERLGAAKFTYGFDELPAHFYHSVFSHILCES
jgi:hypothetical protein